MATISNTPRPGYAWDSTDNCWYPIGVGQHSHNEIAKTVVDAKGDLIVGTGADIVDRKAVGTDGSVLIADSTQTTGVNWAGSLNFAGKNKIINGDFSIWQRGVTLSSTSGSLGDTFLADRWKQNYYGGGNAANYTVSQQAFTPGAAPVAGHESPYFLRHAFPASNASAYWEFYQRIEDVRTLAGQTVTFSFWAKTTGTQYYPTIEVQQNFGSGGSATNYAYLGAQTQTSSWARYTWTFTLGSMSGKTIGAGSYLAFKLYFGPTGTSGTAFNFDIWGVQLEAGSVATSFVPAGGGSQQAEIALCQRYYWRSKGTGAYQNHALGYARSTTECDFSISFPVEMRTIPTVIEWSNQGAHNPSITLSAFTTLVLSEGDTVNSAVLGSGASGLTQFRPYFLANNNNSSAYIAFGAEL